MVFLAACSSGPGSEADLAKALELSENIDSTEADCIAEKIFAECGNDQDALNKISSNTIEELNGETEEQKELAEKNEVDNKKLSGFSEFYDEALTACL